MINPGTIDLSVMANLLNLNKVLRLMRTSHDFSQKELAQKLKISKSHLSELESGKSQPSIPLLQGYASVFEVSVSSIFLLAESYSGMEKKVHPKITALMKFVESREDNNG